LTKFAFPSEKTINRREVFIHYTIYPMKKFSYTLLFLVAFNVAAWAQAILPTSWSFTTTTLPTGWTAVDPIPSYYTASGNTPPAYKFDATGDKITIAFGSNPGNVTYYLAGNSFSGGTDMKPGKATKPYFGIDAKVVGRVVDGPRSLTIHLAEGVFEYATNS
jgi:hypothetical protein